MKPVITKFNDKTGDFEITIPVPFTLKDGIEYANMMIADIPKYEDTKDYNVFDLIRENQELKKKLDELQTLYGKEVYEGDIIEYKDSTGLHHETVLFDKGCFYAGFHGGSSTRVSPKLINIRISKVIGNIYEMEVNNEKI